jgi:hypothetical protein
MWESTTLDPEILGRNRRSCASSLNSLDMGHLGSWNGNPGGTIPVMADQDPDFLASHQSREKISWMPWIVAAGAIVLGLGILVVAGGRGRTESPGGTGMAPVDPYAAKLPITNLQMSEATSFSGAKVTYIDGQITNNGDRTLNGVTVQVGFHGDTGEFAQRLAMPLSLIRTREPYVDTEPVSAAPIQPAQSRDFRLIFDTIPPEWNQQYPEIRVISVHGK